MWISSVLGGSDCKLAKQPGSQHNTTTNLATNYHCQMPLLFLLLSMDLRHFSFLLLFFLNFLEFFFILEILSKQNAESSAVQPKFSCPFASLPNFLFSAKTIYYLAGSLDLKGFANTNKLVVVFCVFFMAFQRINSLASSQLCGLCQQRKIFNLWASSKIQKMF